jgi:hypothetical protein
VEEMKKNRSKLPAATVKDHRCKIAFLIDKMHPPYDHKKAFQKYEKVLGHDLFVKSIMSLSKVGSNKLLLSKFIPVVQCNKFEQVFFPVRKNHPLPKAHKKPARPDPMTSKKQKSTQTNKQSKKKATTKISDSEDRKPAALTKRAASQK